MIRLLSHQGFFSERHAPRAPSQIQRRSLITSGLEDPCAQRFGQFEGMVRWSGWERSLRFARLHGLAREDPDGGVGFEHAVDVFERAARCLRVEEVDDGDHERVEHAPDGVELRAELGDAERGEEDDGEVDEPVRRYPGGHAHDAVLGAVDFGGVEPGDAEPAGSEEAVEEEEEGYGYAA